MSKSSYSVQSQLALILLELLDWLDQWYKFCVLVLWLIHLFWVFNLSYLDGKGMLGMESWCKNISPSYVFFFSKFQEAVVMIRLLFLNQRESVTILSSLLRKLTQKYFPCTNLILNSIFVLPLVGLIKLCPKKSL